MLSNAAKAKNYMRLAKQEFGDRAVAPTPSCRTYWMMVFRRNELWQLSLAEIVGAVHTACGLWIQSVGGVCREKSLWLNNLEFQSTTGRKPEGCGMRCKFSHARYKGPDGFCVFLYHTQDLRCLSRRGDIADTERIGH